MGRFPPRRGALVVIAVVSSLAMAPAASAAPAPDNPKKPDKQTEAAQLAQQLAAQGQHIGMLDEQYNQARIRVDAVSAQLAGVEAKLADAAHNLAAARGRLSKAAVSAYVHGGATPFLGALIKSRAEDVGVRRQYVSVAMADQRDSLDGFDAARRQLIGARDRLRKTRADAQAAADAVAANRHQADAAIAAQRTALSQVQGELAPLVAAASQQQDAKQAVAAQAKFGLPPSPPAQPPAAVAGPGPARATTTTRPAAPAGSTPTTAKPKPPAPVAGPPPPVSSGASAAVSTAKAQLGKPYEYGAAGPDTFDCSGLTMYSWHAGGVSLPHSAEMQYSAIPHVDVTALQPGDLVFFGSPIYHVGIYVGSGQMIEAPHTGTNVRYASIFRSDLVGAGRP